MIAPIHGMCRRAGRGGAVANHLHEALLRRTVKADAPRVGIANRASPHTFRHSFPTPLLEESHDIRTVQELLGHRT